MKRRTFLQSTLTASCLPLLAGTQLKADDDNTQRQFLEWRRYACKDRRQHDLVSNFLKQAVFPGLENTAAKPAGGLR